MRSALRNLVLIHSPLVGAASLLPTAAALERRGWRCRVPTPPPSTAWRDWTARLADDRLGDLDRPILIAHSAAGLLLPSLAERSNAALLIFLDARVPPSHGKVAPVDADFLRFIDTLPTEDGYLPPWSHWWGAKRLERVISDAKMRAQFESDLPRLSRAWFDDVADVPEWSARRCGYLQLSNTYAAEAADAASRGWPVVEVDGAHLDPATAPERTGDALLALIARMQSADANRELDTSAQRKPRR